MTGRQPKPQHAALTRRLADQIADAIEASDPMVNQLFSEVIRGADSVSFMVSTPTGFEWVKLRISVGRGE